MGKKSIKLKAGKGGLVGGIIMLCIVAVAVIVLVYAFVNGEYEGDEMYALIAGAVVFGLIPLMIGCGMISDYNLKSRRMANAINRFGEDEIINEIENKTIESYRSPYNKKSVTYFTEKFIINPNVTLVEYTEIAYIYKHVVNSKYGSITYLCCSLLDGKAIMFCDRIKDEDLSKFFSLIKSKNDTVLVGYSKENDKLYEERVKEHKNS